MPALLIKPLLILIGIAVLFSFQESAPQQSNNSAIEWAKSITGINENDLPADIETGATEVANFAQASEWLGPLAPIAISPFFGIACLAGISQFGGDYLPLNHLMSSNPVLNNPMIFWVFLGLTIITSLPRLTKISKPAAQAIDQLEAYAGIITILVIRFLPMFVGDSPAETETALVIHAGLFSFSADIIFGIAAIINIIVINSVKFFFEVLVWLIPFPLVDAMLELANKSVCAGLMAVYAYSPTLATLLNLLLFVSCLIVFRWIQRRVTFMRSMIGDPIWSLLSPSYGKCTQDCVTVFPQSRWLGFAEKTRLLLRPTDDGWELIQPKFLRPSRIKKLDRVESALTMREGLLVNTIEVSGTNPGKLFFSRRYRNQTDELSRLLRIELSNEVSEEDLKMVLAKA